MEITDEYLVANVNNTALKIARKLQKLAKETAHGAVLITQKGKKVVGFVTSNELIDLIADGKDPMALDAKALMNTDFEEVNENDTLEDIIPKISVSYPNAIVVINDAGECVGYFSKNDYKDALAILGVYDKVHEPKTADDWKTKGIALSTLGKKREALKCFRKSIESSHAKEKSWSGLAKRLERLNRMKDAILCYDQAFKDNPNNDQMIMEKAKLFTDNSQDNQAMISYKKAIEVNPDNVEAYMNISTEQAKLGQIEEAMLNLDKAVEIKGDTPELWYMKGTVYDKAEQWEESLNCYNKATELNSYYEQAWFNKSIALSRLGKNNEAIQCLMKILMMNPANEDVRNALNSYKKEGALKIA
jgi:tetratricopeptide (TPR) repeat protein